MERIKPNCVSYVYLRLNLQSLERYIPPEYPICRYKELEIVERIDQAEAIAFTFKKETRRGKNVLSHIVYIEPENRAQISHRPGYGQEVEVMDMEEVVKKHETFGEGDVFNVVLMRVSLWGKGM